MRVVFESALGLGASVLAFCNVVLLHANQRLRDHVDDLRGVATQEQIDRLYGNAPGRA